jgi:hypothetical protein
VGFQYRVTKYDPRFRDPSGAYTRDEWTSVDDIGRTFGGVTLTAEEYERVETAYASAVVAMLAEAGVEQLIVNALEERRAARAPFAARFDSSSSGSSRPASSPTKNCAAGPTPSAPRSSARISKTSVRLARASAAERQYGRPAMIPRPSLRTAATRSRSTAMSTTRAHCSPVSRSGAAHSIFGGPRTSPKHSATPDSHTVAADTRWAGKERR